MEFFGEMLMDCLPNDGMDMRLDRINFSSERLGQTKTGFVGGVLDRTWARLCRRHAVLMSLLFGQIVLLVGVLSLFAVIDVIDSCDRCRFSMITTLTNATMIRRSDHSVTPKENAALCCCNCRSKKESGRERRATCALVLQGTGSEQHPCHRC